MLKPCITEENGERETMKRREGERERGVMLKREVCE